MQQKQTIRECAGFWMRKSQRVRGFLWGIIWENAQVFGVGRGLKGRAGRAGLRTSGSGSAVWVEGNVYFRKVS